MKRYLAVLVLVTCGVVACTPTSRMIAPASPNAQTHPHRIGILELPPLLLTYPTPPTPGPDPSPAPGPPDPAPPTPAPDPSPLPPRPGPQI